jgi:hypothetical protein
MASGGAVIYKTGLALEKALFAGSKDRIAIVGDVTRTHSAVQILEDSGDGQQPRNKSNIMLEGHCCDMVVCDDRSTGRSLVP